MAANKLGSTPGLYFLGTALLAAGCQQEDLAATNIANVAAGGPLPSSVVSTGGVHVDSGSLAGLRTAMTAWA
jgi:hypothetical protein